jgi:hypothetical protein
VTRRLAFIVVTTLSALLAMHHAPPVTWPVKAIRTPPPEPSRTADTRRIRWPSTHSRVRGNWCAFAATLRNRTCRVAP